MADTGLDDHRRRVVRAWHQRFSTGRPAAGVRPEIKVSWERSLHSTGVDVAAAPVDESIDPVALWRASPLRPAIEAVEDEIQELAQDRGFVAAVMDDQGRILWTAGGRHMRRRAERVNFSPGGRWDEASVGTNALALAFDERRPAQVFSAEHYAEMVHGWCCFAAPLVDPVSGKPLGVLDLSSTWDRAHPMALATVRALAKAAQAVLDNERRPVVTGSTTTVTLLGDRVLHRGGVTVPLPMRQAEVLALLALTDHALTPEELHDQLHGEAHVSVTTTKADVSHLRAQLGGSISHRRYALGASLEVDVLGLRNALRRGDADAAARLYRGPTLASSESPAVAQWRHVLDVAVRDLALRTGSDGLAERLPYDEAVQVTAAAALGPRDPAQAWARARVTRSRLV